MGRGGEAISKAVSAPRTDFHHSYTEEPHATRRKQILAKHPEIETLFQPDIRPLPYVIALVAGHIALAYYSKYMSNLVFFLTAWLVGGAMTHSLSLMTHEVSHNLVFKSQAANKYLGIFCNIGMGVWSSTIFKRYHMEHHQFQGFERDVDIPTVAEAELFKGVFGKLIFVILQPILYGGRPGVVRPKAMTTNEYINTAVVLFTDFLIVRFLGLHALIFMITGLLLGMGLHPSAGHLIAEHYVFENEAETYSYYGPMNLLCWNVGYHNEHHDFPRVPGWRLPDVKRMAPEFYENLPQHKSWVGVIYSFITDPKVTVYSRVKRFEKKKE